MAGTRELSGRAGLEAAPHLEAQLERCCMVTPFHSFSPGPRMSLSPESLCDMGVPLCLQVGIHQWAHKLGNF